VRALAVGIAKAWVDQQSEGADAKAGESEPVHAKVKPKKQALSPVGS